MIRSLYLLALGLLIALFGCSNSEYAPGAGENDYLASLGLKDFVVIRSKGKTVTLGTDEESASIKDRPSMKSYFDYDFIIGKHEVTCKEMKLDCDDSLPATDVTYFDAILYANKKSKAEGFDTAYSYTNLMFDANHSCIGIDGLIFRPLVNAYRLPTEAEWIYVANMGWKPEQAWHNGNSDFKLHAVCSAFTDRNGVCDMAGNAMEWVYDLWVPFHTVDVVDYVGGKASEGVEERVLKGGSYNNDPASLHVYNRGDVYMVASSTKANYVGFRLAFGAIPNPLYLDKQGKEVLQKYTVMVRTNTVKKFIDKPLSKMVFRDDSRDVLVYVDFNDASAPVLELNTGVSAYHPDISPDGKFVAFCTGVEGISGKSKVYVTRLDEGDSTLIELPAESAAIPRFRVLENGDTVIVYVNDAGSNKEEDAFAKQETWQVRFSKGKFGKPEKLFDGGYHGGVSKNDRLAVSGARLLRANVNGQPEIWYNQNQACNVSLSQGGENKTLFLDFGGKTGRKFVGESYGTHERALIADSTGKLLTSVASPEGFSFDHTEWILASDSFFVATITDMNGSHKKVVLVNSYTGEMLSLVEGEELWHPVFWAHDRDKNSRWDYDSLGLYYSESGQATHYLTQKMPVLWTFRDSAEVVALGNSHMQAAVAPDLLSMPAINLSTIPCDMHCIENLYETYISTHFSHLKYLVVGIDFDLWDEYEPGESMALNFGDAPGFRYDYNHDYWRGEIDSAFVERAVKVAEAYKMQSDIIDPRGWMRTECISDWGSDGKEFADVVVDSTWSDDSRRYELNYAQLDKILKIAEQHDVMVIGLITPVSPYYKKTGSYGRHGMRRSDAEILIERLKTVESKTKNFVLMDENKMGNHDYLGDVAYDYDHLCWTGAEKLTARLDSLLIKLESKR
jgi:uncharacterized protein (TIGR02171 family)